MTIDTRSRKNPIIVKFLAKGPAQQNHAVWLRQFPNFSGIWGPCRFIFDPDAVEYDWLVVSDDLPSQGNERFSTRKEHLHCPQEHTLLITTEPITVKSYSKPYLEQFGHILTSQEERFIQHPGAIFSQAGLHWFYGIGRNSYKTYDQMKAAKPLQKERLISTVCSSKQQKHTLHNLRYQFTLRLKAALPGLDHFGHGVTFIDDKAEALDQYRYHIAIENHISPHHWTEKLADPFLAFCLPFYCGCPNAADYFPKDSFISIDLGDFERSFDTIRSAIEDNQYEKRLPAIMEARRLVLDEYNLFAVLAKIIDSRHNILSHSAGSSKTIISRRAMRNKYPLQHAGASLSRFLNRQRTRII